MSSVKHVFRLLHTLKQSIQGTKRPERYCWCSNKYYHLKIELSTRYALLLNPIVLTVLRNVHNNENSLHFKGYSTIQRQSFSSNIQCSMFKCLNCNWIRKRHKFHNCEIWLSSIEPMHIGNNRFEIVECSS